VVTTALGDGTTLHGLSLTYAWPRSRVASQLLQAVAHWPAVHSAICSHGAIVEGRAPQELLTSHSCTMLLNT
jgi:hypothetical protein